MSEKKKINYPAIFFLAIAIILSIILIKNNVSENNKKYDATTVMSRIENLQELTLVKYNYTGVIGFDEYLKILDLNIPFTKKYFLLKYTGYVKAGIELKDTKIEVNNNSAIVILPKPKIFDSFIEEKSIQVYNQSENVFNHIRIDDYNKAIIEEKNKIKEAAIQQGILKSVTEQAHLVISSLLVDMKFEKIEIKDNEGIVIVKKVD